MIVVDASLAAKWLVREIDSSAAVEFLEVEAGVLAAPDLIFVEVAAAIVRRGNERTMTRQDVETAAAKWAVMRSTRVVAGYAVTEARLAAATMLALDLGHPLKDCIYLALAIELDCALATADAGFARKATSRWPNIRMLEDFRRH